MSAMQEQLAINRAKVWDPFVRVFHWSLVSCVTLNLFILEEGKQAHRWSGYIAVGLVLARLLWGFIGSEHARFASFFPTPSRLKNHLGAIRRGQHPQVVGHNPLGALMMFALMGLILSLGVTGYLLRTDAYFEDEMLQDIHGAIANTLMALVGLHALAAIVMSRIERVNLVRAMITGIKEWRQG
ncbi:cytochrome b/b6 domain-containing protein [Vogesella sp. LIG4]|uniref:cytochrome b/b6 domain-containing protein n=1 Tax=Vogesella sp. LIG4 TaxID=1192162 RepID=UPI00081FD6A6|nr:cytochrome b/b6 domain-containing protein [Vogesella sp. LIG4]SCK15788.1 Cytochrome b [Vogesella sp. LIG4]